MHVVTPGAFHTGMNYMGMVTSHKCSGSGFTEILIEAGLVTSGCLYPIHTGPPLLPRSQFGTES